MTRIYDSEKLDALAEAVQQRKDLHEEIVTAGMPPHADFWHQSIYMADQSIDEAYRALEGEGDD